MYDNDYIEKSDENTSLYNHLNIRQYPVIDRCPIYKDNLPIIDSILSNSFSKDIDMKNARYNLVEQISSSEVLADVITIMSMGYAKKAVPSRLNFRAMSIEYVSSVPQHNPNHKTDSAGFFSPIENRLVITKEFSSLEEIKMHEFTHKAMSTIFKDSNAFPYDTINEKNLFLKAKNDFLHNICEFILKNSNDISNNHDVSNICQENNSSVIGKKLLELSITQYNLH